jgi:LuxR family maltose regulon positive regulatory protein
MVPYVTQSMSGLFAGLDDLARAEYAFFKADTAAAEPFAYQALYKAQQAHQYEIENRALYYLYRISIYNGTYEKIPGFLKLLEAQLSQKDYINRDTYYDIVMGWFHIQMGEPEKAAPWIKSDYEESELNALAQGLETLIQIKYHYHTQGYQAALAVMANQKGLYRYGGFLFGKTFFKLLEALCRCRLGEIPEAGRALEEAYALAAPNGLDMIFIEMGRDTQALIDTVGILADSGIPREWLEKIRRAAAVYAQRQDAAAAAFHAPAPRESREARAPGVSLSPREREVLLGLAQGLTRGEIAGLQGVPENAVKSALRRIYTKLGAANRADAVRIAAALKIISP